MATKKQALLTSTTEDNNLKGSNMAVRECDCREFQDSGHTDECNEHYAMQKALALDEQKLIAMGAYDKPATDVEDEK